MSIASPRRTQRRDPGNARVTARDLLGLRFIAKAQPVTTAQVAQLLSMSINMARRRLRVWRDLGLVAVHVTSMEAENRYTLTRRGAQELARALGSDPEDHWVPKGLSRINLAHHDGAVELYVSLEVACARLGLSLVEFFVEREIRQQLGQEDGVLIPDAGAVLQAADGTEIAVAFEVDLSTENPSWFATHKAVPYSELRSAGAPLFGRGAWFVCVVTPSERRTNRLMSAAWEAGLVEGVVVFAEAAEVRPDTILTPIWKTPHHPPGEDTARVVAVSPFVGVITNRDHEPVRPKYPFGAGRS